MTPAFTVIIPANNEAAFLRHCLAALLAQEAAAWPLRVIVSANACSDGTEAIAQGMANDFAEKGGELVCLSSPEPGKPGALNRADAAADAAEAAAPRGPRAYLDADVTCEPALFGDLRAALAAERPLYASGRLAVAPARSRVTRAYAGIWARMPFAAGGTVGAGLFAVNPAGRARWDGFPPIISDDTFARLHFTPAERVEVAARYHWPMVEGWRNLVRVRRRQDAGVAEIARLYPDLVANEGKPRPTPRGLAALALRRPAGFLAYASVHLAVRLQRQGGDWSRGR